MLILALETATALGGVALVKNGELIAEYNLNSPANHSERVLAAIQTVLDDARIRLDQLNGVAVSSGPGSFTALRIGLTTAKSLCFATGLPLAGIPTLTAMAAQFVQPGPLICPCLDARRREIYAAVFKHEKDVLTELIPACVARPDDFFGGVRAHFSQPVLFLGEGATVYRDNIREIFGQQALFAPLHAFHPRAATVAFLGWQKLQRGETDDPITLEPVYLRRSEAEIKWDERNSGG